MTTPDDRPPLTDEGRRQLTERARRLGEETIPALTATIEQGDQEPTIHADYQRATAELERLTRLLDTARSVEELPEDPDMVQVGDWVTVTSDDGETDRYLIVFPIEAVVDANRISADSPLSQALLGHRVGEEVEVDAPRGPYRCRIVEVLRDRGDDTDG